MVQDKLSQTRDFWDANPCDGQSETRRRMQFRYRKEPWLPPLLDEIAEHENVLEIGCGQGTDAIYCCQRMNESASYTGIDISPISVQNAQSAVTTMSSTLRVLPTLVQGNAENLSFDDSSFDCVVSTGVLHHTPSLENSLSEVRRVLRPDGLAVISLYRLFSPKLLGAYALRLPVRFGVRLFAAHDSVRRMLDKIGTDHLLGTMLHECLEVPILNSYTRKELNDAFSAFAAVSIVPVGFGFALFGAAKYIDFNMPWLGAMWVVTARNHADIVK
ncbi:Methyltransferase type 11 [Pseudodesulfovibrio aespoeensis Aspo-2]|uniref:Methyltransferase type 11 n=2 Tax=Desulfovibrionaceae TaxID=194924 RepID=E6VZK1_PSEA9|nr:Methyltransferase type 11 [Pseudodesulfovibrio aespoeensis Aspo-2]